MKILFIQAEPPDDTQDFNFPMGYAALDSVLTKYGHEVEILFTVAYHLNENDIIKKIKETNAQVIGIGGMWPYLKRVELLGKFIREVRPDIKIVIGGWMATYLPELVLQKTGADFIIRGEGEIAFLKLINCLEKKDDCSNIKGLVFFDGRQIINNGFGELMPLEEIPTPNWEKFPMEYYMRISWYFNSFTTGYDRIFGWVTSRGCPQRCNFCTPGQPRYKKIDHLVNELHEINDRFHPTFIYWMDNLTMGNKNYCKSFCEALIKEKFKFRYFITGLVNIVDRELLRLLKESGCVCILYGLESANNNLLKFMNKNITVEQFIEAVRMTKEARIGVNISAMFGQPGETIQDFYNTVKIIMTSCDRKMPYCNNQGFFPLTTFPGSPIYNWAKENRFIKNDEDYYNRFFQYRWINYTQYPRGVVETILGVANLLNTWNYHYHKNKSIEDTISLLNKIISNRLGAKVLFKTIHRQSIRQKIKNLLENPYLKYLLIKLLSIISRKNKIDATEIKQKDTLLMNSKEEIDPKWDVQKQVREFINRLSEDYFVLENKN